MTSGRVLVVGTYPPVPLPSAAATVDAVRRAWAEGFDVTVVSPRLSAADLAVPVSGPFAGLRLERLRRRVGAGRLVLVAEPGFPLAGPAPLQWCTAAGLARAMRRFDDVTLVTVGDLGRSKRWGAPLRAGATRTVEVPASASVEGVTPGGPAEATGLEVPAELAAKVARRVLGRHAAPLRSRLGTLRRRARAAGQAARQAIR